MNILNLNNLIDSLNNNYVDGSIKNFVDILSDYNGVDWQKYISFKEESYSKNLIYKNDKFDMYLVCWKSDDKTPLHDHSKNGCVFKVLQGKINEYLYCPDSLKKQCKNEFSKNNTSYIDNENHYHVMHNESNEITISLHIYSPPNYKIKIYKNN